jgi:hypothetical protein
LGKRRRQAKRTKKRPRSASARAQQAKAKKADSPQLALTLLFHVLLRLPWDWRIGSSDTSEREHLRDMIPHLPADALIVADASESIDAEPLFVKLVEEGRIIYRESFQEQAARADRTWGRYKRVELSPLVSEYRQRFNGMRAQEVKAAKDRLNR